MSTPLFLLENHVGSHFIQFFETFRVAYCTNNIYLLSYEFATLAVINIPHYL